MHLLTPADLRLFGQGLDHRAYEKLGAHARRRAACPSPSGRRTRRASSVIGDFNGWSAGRVAARARRRHGRLARGRPGGAGAGRVYKYRIESRVGGYVVEKADPYGFLHEAPPAHRVDRRRDLDYAWSDARVAGAARQAADALDAPMSIYEVHLGSWKRVREEGFRSLHYRELAPQLAEYVARMGFTHVELMPVMEHPFFGSWGYQVTGYFAPSHRYGTRRGLHVPRRHAAPARDRRHPRLGAGALPDRRARRSAFFDGTHLYEHADPRQGFHPEWNSFIFNYARNEVRSFLLSSALFWLDRYHADGLRVDGVSSMLYLDYARKPGEWIPNEHGGRENLAAVDVPARAQRDGLPRAPRRRR